jgi:hypothetical protein
MDGAVFMFTRARLAAAAILIALATAIARVGDYQTVMSMLPDGVRGWLMAGEHLQLISLGFCALGLVLLFRMAWNSALNADAARDAKRRISDLEGHFALLLETADKALETAKELSAKYDAHFQELQPELRRTAESRHGEMMRQVEAIRETAVATVRKDMTHLLHEHQIRLRDEHSERIALLEDGLRKVEAAKPKETGQDGEG